jgi:hypothetical protein
LQVINAALTDCQEKLSPESTFPPTGINREHSDDCEETGRFLLITG